MPRHILVFGGTSPAGIAFCLAALRDQHTLTLYVRNPSKLPVEISSNITAIVGQLTDASTIEEAIQCGAKTCVSFLGPVLSEAKRGYTPIADSYRIVLPLLLKHKYERTLHVSTPSYKAPQDQFSLLFWIAVWGVYLFVWPAYNEMIEMTPLITELPVDEIKWTVLRVPMLKDGEARPVKAGFVGDGIGFRLERKALAEWALTEMEEEKWVGMCPELSNV